MTGSKQGPFERFDQSEFSEPSELGHLIASVKKDLIRVLYYLLALVMNSFFIRVYFFFSNQNDLGSLIWAEKYIVSFVGIILQRP